jgi:predicted nucleic acid-binding protein
MAIRYAIDSNVLLRLSHRSHPQQKIIAESIRFLVGRGAELCYTSQNAGEFWNVCTRPLDRNGFGLSIEDTVFRLGFIQDEMTLLPEVEDVFPVWLELLRLHEVRGVQVHDAHLAAVLKVHQVAHLLTFNGTDFKRFPGLITVDPNGVLADL